MDSNEDDNIKKLIEMGAEIAGSAATAYVGAYFAGPLGGAVTAGASPLIISGFKKVGNEVLRRLFSERQLIRAGGATAIALQKIKYRLERDDQVRTDGFFETATEERSAAVETLEGVLLAAQDEYQEKKVKFYGNLYANLVFDETINRAHANYLIGLLDRLSYRQLCMIAEANAGTYNLEWNSPRKDLANEINELVALGIVRREPSGSSFDFHYIEPYGDKVCLLFGLDEIDRDERQLTLRPELISKEKS